MGQGLQCLGNTRDHRGPVTKGRLPEDAQLRIPGAVLPARQPSPFVVEAIEHPDGRAQAARQTERGNRADDKRSETAMEDRKKEGYF